MIGSNSNSNCAVPLKHPAGTSELNAGRGGGQDCASELARLCERGLAQSIRLGRGCLVVWAKELPPTEELDLLECARVFQDKEGSSFYWERPSIQQGLATGGRVRELKGEGAARFEELATQVARLQQEAIGETTAGKSLPEPLLVGGFSFFPQLADDLWSEFGVASMSLPKLALVFVGGQRVALVQAWIEPQHELAAVITQLKESWQRICSVCQNKGSHKGSHKGSSKGSGKGGDGKGSGKGGDGKRQAGAESPRLVAESEWLAWQAAIKELKQMMSSGELHKVALAQMRSYTMQADAYQASAKLRASYPDCYCFCIRPGKRGILLGASPERLISFEGSVARLSALAGTAARGSDAVKDCQYAQQLLASPKDREEHRLVVEQITSTLANYGTVKFPAQPSLMRLANVQHLFTPIVFNADKEISPLKLLGQLHPTPAVGGYPRSRALRAIRELESFERGWFAAPIGWLQGAAHGEFAVALRCGLLLPEQAHLFVGAGILAASEPATEWQELQWKLQPMLAALCQ